MIASIEHPEPFSRECDPRPRETAGWLLASGMGGCHTGKPALDNQLEFPLFRMNCCREMRIENDHDRQKHAPKQASAMKRRKILLGSFMAVTLVLVLCAAAFTRVDLSADADPSWLETRLASALLQARLRLDRPSKSSPLAPTEEDLVRGSELYETRCANCHGATRGRMALLAKSFSPRPPQFVIQPAQNPTWMDAYIIQHGVRWSGMPAFRALSVADAWRLALYVEGRHNPKE